MIGELTAVTVDLRQVAALSGVSVSTASRALTGSSRVSAATAARVRAAAAALGYRPNTSARALRGVRSRFIGLVVTNLVNTSLQAIAEVARREFARHDYQLMLAITEGDPVQERAALRTLVDYNAAGVIVVGSDAAAADELRERGTPTVHLARRPARLAGDCVLGDEIAGARVATEYLLAAGHRRIAIIAGPRDVQSGRERMAGYWLALQAAGAAAPDELAPHVALTPQAGAAAARALLALPARRRPTALLVANHEACYGVLPALREHPVAIPGDLSVICYEDSPLARWWHPAVTVIDNNAREMGELAARLLLRRLDPADGDRSADADRSADRDADADAGGGGGGGGGGGERDRDRDRDRFSEFRVGTRIVERDSCQPPGIPPAPPVPARKHRVELGAQ